MSKSMINNRFLEETVFAIADGYCVINLTKNYVPGSCTRSLMAGNIT